MSDDLAFLDAVSTSLVSDVLERLGVPGQCESIRPLLPEMHVSGRAFTVRVMPQTDPPSPYVDYQDDLGQGDVCVLASGGFMGGGSWGDLRTLMSQRVGVAGVVIDGAVRDTRGCLESGFPTFVRGTTMYTGNRRLRVEGKQVPVEIDGVPVSPSDIVVADADGVTVIPKRLEAEALPLLREFHRADEKIMEAIRQGVPLKEARLRYAYNPPPTEK